MDPSVSTIGSGGSDFRLLVSISDMRQPPSPDESIHVSARFRLTLESAILSLEAGAALDERALPLLHDPDHRRRQRLLIVSQRERAIRLRELLARTAVRPERAA